MDKYVIQSHSGNGDNVNGPKYEFYYNTSADKELEYEEIIHRKNEYCKYAVGEYLCLPIIESEKIIDIEKIYVTLVLTHDNLSNEKVIVDTSGISIDNFIDTIDMHRDLGSPQKIKNDDIVSLRDMLGYKKVIILGEPGIGKSTLLKKIFVDICKMKYFSEYLPIYIPLSNITSNHVGFIDDYIIKKYRKLKGVLEYFIETGHTFFLLDGLDEIDHVTQQFVSSVINYYVSKGNKVFLTCRTTVFPRGMLSSDFKIFECIGFNAAQRRKFLRLWFNEDLLLASVIENEIVNHLGTAGISRNPLLLSLIAMQFEDNNDFKLPQKRISIYLKSIQLLLHRRDQKNIWNIPIYVRIDLLEYIAFHMSIDNIDVISEKNLREIIANWKSENTDSILAQYATDVLLELFIDIDGILYRCSKNHMRFLHLVLQESLTANYLAKQDNWFIVFKSKKYLPRWEETIRLLFSLVTQDPYQNNMLVDYLYHEAIDNQDHLFIIGRYISDFHSSKANKFYSIFQEILKYLITGTDQLNYSDALVSLASICNSHTMYRDYAITFFNQEFKNSYFLLYTYIRLLKLMPSQASRKEVAKLINFFSHKNFNRSTSLSMIGMLINSLDYYSDYPFWRETYLKYVNSRNSHLSGIIASALSNIQPIEMCGFLENELKKADTNKKYLLSYILQKYEDEDVTERFLIYVIENHDTNLAQTIAENCLINNEKITKLVMQEKDEHCLAMLLDSGITLSKGNGYQFLQSIFQNKNHSLSLRCAALNAYLMENNNHKKRIHMVIDFLKCNDTKTDLHLVCVNHLLRQENRLISDYYFEQGSKLNERIICSLTRILCNTVIEGAIIWLQDILYKYKIGSTIHMYSVLALAKQGYPDLFNYIKNYILRFPRMHFREKVLIIKSLCIGNTDHREEWLIKLLKLETDINIISLIIENMGDIKEKAIEEILLEYLDVTNWPLNWPRPLSELKQGEQRPSDRRLIMIILSLNKLGCKDAIPLLHKLFNDLGYSNDVRRTAYIVYKNLLWDSDSIIS